MKSKKGISPLIATVLIIGFTIVLAALVIQWGGSLFKNIQEETGETSELNIACTELLTGLEVTPTPGILNNRKYIDLVVDNTKNKEIAGFIFRVYNEGETKVDVFDTTNEEDQGLIGLQGEEQEFSLEANNLKVYRLFYDNAEIPTPVKVGIKPIIKVGSKLEPCSRETTKEI